ncbi:hypothetical protein [Bradyrhizobium sp. F1.13.3]|uniref:hypothetical protein n=1 Tax=Bradyrhizobium sp. F1.13.3 TaxID=3156351 RepID=UPI003397B304
MLAVTIEIVPDGDETRRRPVAAMRIEQVSTTHSLCEYAVDTIEDGDGLIATAASFSSCVVEHLRTEGDVWKVLGNACRAIAAAGTDGPPGFAEHLYD